MLSGGIDIDAEKRERFTMRYAAPSFADLDSALATVQPNVVVVATPTATHRNAVDSILKTFRPQAILCEKPLSARLEEAKAIMDACAAANCALYVNYMRNSEPGALEVKRRLLDGRIKVHVKGVVCNLGVFNNGSHFLNLLQDWLGEVCKVRVNSPGRCWDGLDPEPDFWVSFSRGEVSFFASKEENFSHYTLELIAANGRLRYEQAGNEILWQQAVCDPVFDGYMILEARKFYQVQF